jgi:carboxylate-amine ligase
VTMPDLRTVGVEEELLLARASTGALAAAATDLLRDPRAAGRLSHEFKREQIEITSDPCASMAALAENLRSQRGHLAAVAARYGVVACASGTSPLPGVPSVVAGERFARITDEFALMATEQLTCGMHVHVSVASPEEGVGVLDRIRGWLPVLTALCVNSPFWQGIDSGYASYRMIVLSELPPAGPTPIWGSHDAYRRAVEQTIATGAAFDPAMVYFDARLSATYPTVEIRVTDVCRRVDEAVMTAALCRALIDTAAAEWAAGKEPVDLAVSAIRSASWRAARHGMGDKLFDPVLGRLTPAWNVVAELLAHVRIALRTNGDAELVRAALNRIHNLGTGADRQRAARRGGQSLSGVLLDSQIGASMSIGVNV